MHRRARGPILTLRADPLAAPGAMAPTTDATLSPKYHPLRAGLTVAGMYTAFAGWMYFAWYEHHKDIPYKFGGDDEDCGPEHGLSRWFSRCALLGWAGDTTYAGGEDKFGHAWSTMALARLYRRDPRAVGRLRSHGVDADRHGLVRGCCSSASRFATASTSSSRTAISAATRPVRSSRSRSCNGRGSTRCSTFACSTSRARCTSASSTVHRRARSAAVRAGTSRRITRARRTCSRFISVDRRAARDPDVRLHFAVRRRRRRVRHAQLQADARIPASAAGRCRRRSSAVVQRTGLLRLAARRHVEPDGPQGDARARRGVQPAVLVGGHPALRALAVRGVHAGAGRRAVSARAV